MTTKPTEQEIEREACAAFDASVISCDYEATERIARELFYTNGFIAGHASGIAKGRELERVEQESRCQYNKEWFDVATDRIKGLEAELLRAVPIIRACSKAVLGTTSKALNAFPMAKALTAKDEK